MKHISSTQWGFIKDHPSIQAGITLFEKAAHPEFGPEDSLALCKKIDQSYWMNNGEINDQIFIHNWSYFRELVSTVKEKLPVNELSDADAVYAAVMKADMESTLRKFEEREYKKKFNKENMTYKLELSFNMELSMALYAFFPNLFLPNLFVMQFMCLQRFAEKYEIELPKIPVRTNYQGRCFYYLEMCKCLWEFGRFNGIDDPAELCAFIYCNEVPSIHEEIDSNKGKGFPEKASQAWFLVGEYGSGEKEMDYGFWQANALTNRGDILVFFEKAPKKALNSIWIAQEDGVVDPFFVYYSHSYIGNKIPIPEIGYDELVVHPYFSNNSLVHKKFQGGSGWPMSSEDYKQLLILLEEKGFDVSQLPKLYEPYGIVPEDLGNEADVSKQMICKLLNEMGWIEGRDFSPEVHFAAGHGETGNRKDKRPDFCLHEYKVNDKPRAKVLIESKFFLKNNDAIKEAFDQTETYAGWGHSRVMLICDRNQIRVYEKNRHDEFSLDHRTIYRWSQMKNNDKFQELKNKLRK